MTEGWGSSEFGKYDSEVWRKKEWDTGGKTCKGNSKSSFKRQGNIPSPPSKPSLQILTRKPLSMVFIYSSLTSHYSNKAGKFLAYSAFLSIIIRIIISKHRNRTTLYSFINIPKFNGTHNGSMARIRLHGSKRRKKK